MIDRMVLLGTKGGPSIRKGGPNPSSSLLQLNGRSMVIDCGIGVSRALVEADVSLAQIDDIFITHLHSDHVLELGPLLYTAWTSGLTNPLTVYGPVGIEDYWSSFLQAMSFDHGVRTIDDKRKPITELVNIVTYREGIVINSNDRSVSALRVNHPPIEHCYALRFEANGLSVVFSADTCFHPPLADFAQGADVLVHEAMLGRGIDALVARMAGAPGLRAHLIASHTMAEDVGRIATVANAGQLVLNHLVPSDDPVFSESDWKAALTKTWSGPVTVGKDGLCIPLLKADT